MAPMPDTQLRVQSPKGHPALRECLHEIHNANNLGLLNSSLLLRIWDDLSPFLERLEQEQPELTLGNLPLRLLREEVPQMLKGQEEAAERILRATRTIRELDLVPRETV